LPPTETQLSDSYCRVLAEIGDGKVNVNAGNYTIGSGEATAAEVGHIRRAVERHEHADCDRHGWYYLTPKGKTALSAAWPAWTPRRY
jgi:hypothetical protein